MSEHGYPRCGKVTEVPNAQFPSLAGRECDGTLVPLSTVTDVTKAESIRTGVTAITPLEKMVLPFGKWVCTKCGRVVE